MYMPLAIVIKTIVVFKPHFKDFIAQQALFCRFSAEILNFFHQSFKLLELLREGKKEEIFTFQAKEFKLWLIRCIAVEKNAKFQLNISKIFLVGQKCLGHWGKEVTIIVLVLVNMV